MNNIYKIKDYLYDKEKDLMKKLKVAREKSGISVIEMARSLHIAPAAYRRYERGEVSPKISVCAEICKVLGSSIGQVFDEDYEPPKSIDLSYRARPGQTLYIKVEVDETGNMVPILDRNDKKIANGE